MSKNIFWSESFHSDSSRVISFWSSLSLESFLWVLISLSLNGSGRVCGVQAFLSEMFFPIMHVKMQQFYQKQSCQVGLSYTHFTTHLHCNTYSTSTLSLCLVFPPFREFGFEPNQWFRLR